MAGKFTEKHKKFLGIIAIIIVILFSAAIFLLVGKPLISFVSEPEKFRQWVDAFGIWGRLLFIGMIVLQVIIAIIPGEPFEIAAGYAFGSLEGMILCMAGIITGSIIIFLLVRKFGMMLVEVFFSKEKIASLTFLQNNKKMNLLFFVIMLIPGTPKDLLSYFAGLTEMKLSSWILIVAVSRIPSVITSSIGGSALGEKKYLFAVIAFAVTIIISGMGLLIYKKVQSKRKN